MNEIASTGFFPDTFSGRADIGVVGGHLEAHSFEMLRDRQEEWQRRIALLEQAQHFIYVSTYYLQWDQYGTRFLEALLQASARGVHVVLVLDSFGQKLCGLAMGPWDKDLLNEKLEELRAAGGEVSSYSPAYRSQRWIGGGQHIKIQVTDKGLAMFGSSNISLDSYERWDELSVVVSGSVTLAMLDTFACIDIEVRPEDRAMLEDRCRKQTNQPILFDFGAFNPNPLSGARTPFLRRTTNSQTLGIAQAIREAQESILITCFYYKPPPLLRQEILNARARGVRVAIYHSHLEALSEMRLSWLASAVDYPSLFNAGVEIYESLNGEHSKTVLVDDKLAMLGSYNFEHAADDRLAEATLVSTDHRVVAAIRGIIEECELRFEQITKDDFENLPSSLHWQRQLVRPFKRWV